MYQGTRARKAGRGGQGAIPSIARILGVLRSPGVACLAVLLSLVAVASLDAQQSATVAVKGGYLIDGNGGPPLQNSVILVEGERITHVGTVADTEIPSGARVIDANGLTVMPGLFETHDHLIGATHGRYSEFFPDYRDRYQEIALVSARQLLTAGVTSARDMGMPLDDAIAVKEEVESGRALGPRLFVAGPFLQKSFADYWGDVRWAVDGSDDARRKTRRLIDAGVDFIKVIQVADLTAQERAAIAAEAEEAGLHIAVHASSVEELRAAVEMDALTVEHVGGGTRPLLKEEWVDLMVDNRVFWVPTSVVSKVYDITQEYPERLDHPRLERELPTDLYRDIKESWQFFSRLDYFDGAYWNQYHDDKIMQGYEAGVQILVGTDAGTPMNFHFDAMRNEMELLTEYGMEPMQVIMAATKYPPVLFGMEDDLGTIEPGKYADIILVDGNPLDHMSDLRNVVTVLKGGEVVVEDGALVDNP